MNMEEITAAMGSKVEQINLINYHIDELITLLTLNPLHPLKTQY